MVRFISPEVGSLKKKELVRNCEAETIKKKRNFRLKAKHKVPYKKRVYD